MRNYVVMALEYPLNELLSYESMRSLKIQRASKPTITLMAAPSTASMRTRKSSLRLLSLKPFNPEFAIDG
jgi:hypothetical protein